MWAAMGGQTECLLELLKSGADVNPMNNNGKTALMYHYGLIYPTCILELIKVGADVNSGESYLPVLELEFRNCF